MRINARLDDDHSDKVQYLVNTQNTSISAVLKRAIDLYYEQARSNEYSAKQGLSDAGFIGVSEADEDLSTDYKRHWATALADKHGG